MRHSFGPPLAYFNVPQSQSKNTKNPEGGGTFASPSLAFPRSPRVWPGCLGCSAGHQGGQIGRLGGQCGQQRRTACQQLNLRQGLRNLAHRPSGREHCTQAPVWLLIGRGGWTFPLPNCALGARYPLLRQGGVPSWLGASFGRLGRWRWGSVWSAPPPVGMFGGDGTVGLWHRSSGAFAPCGTRTA